MLAATAAELRARATRPAPVARAGGGASGGASGVPHCSIGPRSRVHSGAISARRACAHARPLKFEALAALEAFALGLQKQGGQQWALAWTIRHHSSSGPRARYRKTARAADFRCVYYCRTYYQAVCGGGGGQ